MHMYAYVYVYVHIYIYIYMHLHMYICMRICIYTDPFQGRCDGFDHAVARSFQFAWLTSDQDGDLKDFFFFKGCMDRASHLRLSVLVPYLFDQAGHDTFFLPDLAAQHQTTGIDSGTPPVPLLLQGRNTLIL